MIPIFKNKKKEIIEVVLRYGADGTTVAQDERELQEWLERGFMPYCVFYRGSDKHYCMSRVNDS